MRYVVKDGQRVPLSAESPSPPPPGPVSQRPPAHNSPPTSPPRDQLASVLDTLNHEVQLHHGSVEELWEQLRTSVVRSHRGGS